MADNQVPWQGGGSFQPDQPCRFTARVQFDGDVNILDTVTVNDSVAADGTTQLLSVTGRLADSPTANQTAIYFGVTSVGQSAFNQAALVTQLLSGYTGSGDTFGAYIETAAASSGAGMFSPTNVGLEGTAVGTATGDNKGLLGFAENAAGKNTGVVGIAVTTKNGATNIGGAFFGRNAGTSPTQIGVYAGLNDSSPTFESSALIADNAAVAAPIILARDNGTTVWSVQDGGSVQGKMGTKTLSEGVATGFVRIACAQGARVGGCIKYTIEANDAADLQIRTGILPFAIVNKAGAETGAVATVSTATETVAVSAGTLTNTFTITSNAADTMDIEANATSSLAQTTLRINYAVEVYGNAIVAVTPL